jgi:hypothetical protein
MTDPGRPNIRVRDMTQTAGHRRQIRRAPRLNDLRADHAAIEPHLIRLAVLGRNFTPRLGAGPDWRALSKIWRDLARETGR